MSSLLEAGELLDGRGIDGFIDAGPRSAEDTQRSEKGLIWQRRFTHPPVKPADAHRRLDKSHRLGSILSHVEPRVVTNDYTVRHTNVFWQIARADVRPGLRGAREEIEERLDGSRVLRFGEHRLVLKACSAPPPVVKPNGPSAARRQAPHRPSEWMKNFDLKQGKLWSVLEQEAGGDAPK